jgi:hypothetical protein
VLGVHLKKNDFPLFLKVCGDGVEYPVRAIDGPGGVANNGWWAID